MRTLYESILNRNDVIKNVDMTAAIITAFREYYSQRKFKLDQIPEVSIKSGILKIIYTDAYSSSNCFPGTVIDAATNAGCKIIELQNFAGCVYLLKDIDAKDITLRSDRQFINFWDEVNYKPYTLKNCKFDGEVRLDGHIELESCDLHDGVTLALGSGKLNKCHIVGEFYMTQLFYDEGKNRDLYNSFKYIGKKLTPLKAKFKKIKRPAIIPNIEDTFPIKNCKIDCDKITLSCTTNMPDSETVSDIVYSKKKLDLYVNDVINNYKTADGKYYVYAIWGRRSERILKSYKILNK